MEGELLQSNELFYLKFERVSLIYKEGDKKEIGNYRPIFVFSNAAKLYSINELSKCKQNLKSMPLRLPSKPLNNVISYFKY